MICQRCGGTGKVREVSGEYAQDDMLPCLACQMFCRGCHQWVSKDGHECECRQEPA